MIDADVFFCVFLAIIQKYITRGTNIYISEFSLYFVYYQYCFVHFRVLRRTQVQKIKVLVVTSNQYEFCAFFGVIFFLLLLRVVHVLFLRFLKLLNTRTCVQQQQQQLEDTVSHQKLGNSQPSKAREQSQNWFDFNQERHKFMASERWIESGSSRRDAYHKNIA